MCTLTFFPLNHEQFILGSSRDVTRDRAQAVAPDMYYEKNGNAICPIDPQGGGTWWFSSEKGWSAVLLNGGFENHTPTPPYRLSRGQIMLQLLKTSCPDTFLATVDLNKIEPFTIILFDHRNHLQISQCAWNGDQKYISEIDASTPYVWSSATLYNKEQASRVSQWYSNFLSQNSAISNQQIKTFHLDQSDFVEYPVILNRPNHCTVSFSSLQIIKGEIIIQYYDLLDSTSYNKHIHWKSINAMP